MLLKTIRCFKVQNEELCKYKDSECMGYVFLVLWDTYKCYVISIYSNMILVIH